VSNPNVDIVVGKTRVFWQEIPFILTAVVLLALVVLANAENSFVLNILTLTFLLGGLSTSWNIIGGFGGQFSLAHSVFFAIGAYTTANLYLKLGLTPWIGLLVSAVVGAVIACLVSAPVFRLRGPFFAIATMAFTEVAQALAMHFEQYTGGARGLIIPFHASFANMIFPTRLPYTIIMLAFVATTLIVASYIYRSKLGYYLQALRDNDSTAQASGIVVLRTKLVAMAISAALTSVGGALFMMYIRVADPPALLSLFDIGVKIALISLIGGVGTIYGPLLGALLIVPLEAWLKTQLGTQFPGASLIVLGALLVIASLYLKHGVWGAIVGLKERLQRSAAR
jgi:branched-chain amino acid transport system permease protein